MSCLKVMKSLESVPINLSLKCPFTMMVVGASKSGKSTFVRRLLTKRVDKYDKHPGKVIWFYKIWQSMYDEMLKQNIVNQCEEGMPTCEWLKNNLPKNKNTTIVIDDMALESNFDTIKIFTVLSHHYMVNVIFIAQNLYTKNKAFREISLNTSYLTYMKNTRDGMQFSSFSRQFKPGRSKDMSDIMKDATERPHSYLFIDFQQDTEEKYRIQSDILKEDEEFPFPKLYILN